MIDDERERDSTKSLCPGFGERKRLAGPKKAKKPT
jgi:hypothetical protein